MKFLVALTLAGLGSASAFGAAPYTAVEKGDPVRSTAVLPARVPAPKGQFSLFADFGKKDGWSVPLYLVNRTTRPVTLITHRETGLPFFQREYLAAPGKWKPAHSIAYPMCGFDLKSVTLPPDSYMVVKAGVAYGGFKAKVRYRLDGETKPISNVGEGLVSHDDLSCLLISTTKDFALLSNIALGEYTPPTEEADYRTLAITRLIEFDQRKSEPVLKRIAAGDDANCAKTAKAMLDVLRQSSK